MPTYNDGNVPFGSFILTIGGTAFTAENLSPNTPVSKIERRGIVGEPTGKVTIDDFETATVTVQRPATSTALPALGAAVVAPSGSLLAGSWYVSDRGAVFANQDNHKFNITLDKAYG